MHRIFIALDLSNNYQIDDNIEKNHKKTKKKRENSIKISDALFDIALRKGLIEKTERGYIFIGDYEELLAFRKDKKDQLIN